MTPEKNSPTKDAPTQRDGRLAYRLKEVSAMVGVPVSTLRTMIHRQELNPIVSFGTWLIPAEDLHALLGHRLHNTRRSPGPKEDRA